MFDTWFPAHWSTLKKLIWLRMTALGNVIKTVTGTIVTFVTSKAAPIVSLTASLSPIQDLHGYDNPWPSGGGTNKLNQDGTDTNNGYVHGAYINTSGVVATAQGTWDVLEYIPLKPSTTYTLSGAMGNNANGYALYDAEKNLVGYGTVLTSTITFTTTADTAFGRFNRDYANSFYMQLEEGGTATTFVPYSNVCPISGHTGVTVYRTGRNLLNPASPNYPETLIATDGSASTNPNFNTWEYKKAETYTVSINVTETTNPGRVVVFNADGTVKSATGFTATVGRQSLTFTLASGEKALVSIRVSATELQAELSSSASAYEPYTGTTYPITFPDAAGTVYGGTLKVNEDGSGTLTLDEVLFTIDGSGIEAKGGGTSSAINFARTPVLPSATYNRNINADCCDQYPVVDAAITDTSKIGVRFNPNGYIYIFNNAFTDLATAQAALNASPIHLVLTLTTPIVYTLTAEQVGAVITTLKGTNTIWVDDSDEISVTYYE